MLDREGLATGAVSRLSSISQSKSISEGFLMESKTMFFKWKNHKPAGSPFLRVEIQLPMDSEAVCLKEPFAPSNSHSSINATYRHYEKIKKRQYEKRIREVEHSSFTPLVFSTTGSMVPAAASFYMRLASMLADKWKQPYSKTMGWLRCRLSFCLFGSSIMCLRGARSSAHRFDSNLTAAVDLTVTDSNLRL